MNCQCGLFERYQQKQLFPTLDLHHIVANCQESHRWASHGIGPSTLGIGNQGVCTSVGIGLFGIITICFGGSGFGRRAVDGDRVVVVE